VRKIEIVLDLIYLSLSGASLSQVFLFIFYAYFLLMIFFCAHVWKAKFKLLFLL